VFNELDSVMSLSEPDVITQFLHLREADHSRDAELRELADCTVRMLFKPNAFKTPTTYALKFRSETLRVMDLFQGAFPHAKNLYLYRDAEGFVRSFYRLFRRDDESDEYTPVDEFIAFCSQLFNYNFSPIAVYLDPDTDQVSTVQYLAAWWLAIMEWYVEQAARGIPVLAVRYADIVAHREQVLAAIFEYCGLPVNHISKTLSAFERDSQAGTWLARETPNTG
jgi:hypothetical protein